jgi:signal transduction histidine kinase
LYLEKFGIIPELIDRENLNVEGIDLSDIAIVVKNSNEAKSVIQNLTSIEQAAKLIWYYNTNNIKRMKVKKNQLDIEPTPIHQIDDIIFNVLWPFEHFIFKRRHNVHLIKGITQKMKMFADWRLYELVLFNLVQNSIKYNKNFDGDVVIVTRMKPLKRREFDNLDAEINYVLETMILDTGMGIQEDRQDLLFIPFLELKDRLGIMKTQNDNIGIGLACSKEICKHLGGDIVLKISNKGLTAFSFKVPITVQFDEVEVPSLQLSEQMAPKNDFVIHRLMGSERPIPDCIFDLLELMKVFNNAQVNSMDRQSKSMKSRHHNYAVQQSPVIAMQKYGF